jgi:hypothetical protein
MQQWGSRQILPPLVVFDEHLESEKLENRREVGVSFVILPRR